MAAPIATTSSGFTFQAGSRPKNAFTTSITLGIRVMPPTRINLVNVRRRHTGVFQCGLAGVNRAGDQIFHQAFQLGPRQLDDNLLRPPPHPP